MPDTNRFSIKTLLALVLVPVLVAGGFLWGTWNSGDRLHQVEAAVVNLDEGVTLNDQFVPLGRQLSADLVDSNKEQNFGWVLADEAHAWPGLASGRYAAVVVIPKNFSKAATSYANDDPTTAEQATIEVHTSPVAGVADAWLGNVLANAASQSLNRTLTEAYLDQIYIGFNDTGKQFQTVADAADKLADGTEQLSDGVTSAADGAGELSTGMNKLSTSGAQLVNGVQQVETGAGSLAKGLQTMKSQTKDLPTQGKQLASGVKQYVAGANKLADQLSAAASGSAELAGGVTQLANGLDAYHQAMTAASEDPDTLGVECPYEQVPELGEQLCDAYNNGIRTGTGAAAKGVSQLATGLGQLSDELNDSLPSAAEQQAAAKQLAAFKAGGKELVTGSAQLGTGLGQLSTGIGQAADGATKLADGLPQLTSGVKEYTGGVTSAAKGTRELASGLDSAADGGEQLANGSRTLADGLAKGASRIPSYSKADRENLSTVVAAPVSSSGIDGVVAPTVAWASLLIALALWLGALASYAVVKPLDSRLALSTASSATLIWRALLPGVIVAVAQAIVLTAIGAGVLSLALPKAAALAGFLVLAGVSFVLVNHALAAWLGNAGRLIAVAMAVLTTVSAVTSAAPAFFDSARSVSPVSPMLDGLRALLTDSTGAPAAVFTLLGWALLALGASAAAVLRRRSLRLNEVPALA
ncbi:YhgE/Pip domain-containing protein [Micropruina sonneratiae]|uniref:YhgE/Pip domain-containing protein n=1 Tax=Micropruina sonneratiae TaxID=2986940 RepID=UPI002225F0BC|nr:YhgE/Pip family protein [Micropruina sp. KQZ13P-5]MCW3159217.1 YhgE/Pip family protein [Micropruina sp. KQZ13P-5]